MEQTARYFQFLVLAIKSTKQISALQGNEKVFEDNKKLFNHEQLKIS